MPGASSHADRPTCGRCGYDRSGEIATWTDRCPLEGTCPECGLTLPWVDVLRAERNLCRGFIEHIPRREPGQSRLRHAWRWYAAAWRTWFWALLPWMLWSRVRVTQPVRVWRAVAGIVIIGMTMYGVDVILRFTQSIQIAGWNLSPGHYPIVENLRYCIMGPFSQLSTTYYNPYMIGGGMPGQFALSLTEFSLLVFFLPGWFAVSMPALFVALGTTMRTLPIRSAHLVRSAVFGLACIPIAWMIACIDTVRMMIWQARTPSAPFMHSPAPGVFVISVTPPTEYLWEILDNVPLVYLAAITWSGIYWWVTLRGWGLARPLLHTLVLLVPCGLAPIVPLLYLISF